MKNNIIKIVAPIVIAVLCLVGCTEEYADYTAPDEIHDTSWIIGFNANTSGEDRFLVNVDTHISFVDVSQGFQDHRWIIEKGNSFLKAGFTSTDSLPLFIKNNDTITTDLKAHVLFRKQGNNKIRLLNTYTKPFKYTTSLGTFETKKVGDLHVIDTTFNFYAYGHIKPRFRILQEGVEKLLVTEDEIPSIEDKDSWPTVVVEAGSSLTYEDLTTEGEPNSRSWKVEGGSIAKANLQEAPVKFFKLGTFDAGTVTVSRADLGRDFPNASVDRIIPLKVKVIKSSQPFVINGNIRETESEVLRFQVTGEIAPFTGQESFFTVNVKNQGFDQNIDVLSARVSDDDATFIELTLSAPIYNSDEITVNYAGGSIMSSDERTLEDFAAPIKVIPYFAPNVLASNVGFESSASQANRAFADTYWIGNANIHSGGTYYTRTTEKSASGEASMKYQTTEANPIPTLILSNSAIAAPNGIPAGTYQFSMKLYIEPGSNVKAFRAIFNKPTWVSTDFNFETINKGEWVEVSKEIVIPSDFSASGTSFQLRILSALNAGVTGAQTMYIDDISLKTIELRP